MNFRRDGYDFDALWDDEKASFRQKKIMDLSEKHSVPVQYQNSSQNYILISNMAINLLNVSCPSRQVSVRYPFSVSHAESPR